MEFFFHSGFWPSNRKEKKEKKNDKKTSKNPKGTKAVANPQQPLSSILDDQNLPTNPSDETNEFHRMMGSIDGLNQISNITKSKCVSDWWWWSFMTEPISSNDFSQHPNLTLNRVHLFLQQWLIEPPVKVQYLFPVHRCVNRPVRVTAAMTMKMICPSQKSILKSIQQQHKNRQLLKRMMKRKSAMLWD